jgi:hypothetical protein
MKFRVCPRCGSKNIFAGKMSSGILYGVSSWTEECRNCGFKGSPVVFDSKEDYLLFLKGLHAEDDNESTSNGEDDVKLSKEESIEDTYSDGKNEHWHNWTWLWEIVLAIVIGISISVISSLRNVRLFGVGVGIVYSILEFIIFFIFVLIVIIIIEYIIYLIVKKARNLDEVD